MKKLTKLIGLKKSDFDEIVRNQGNDTQITLRSARLIPALKTGDEMALTSQTLIQTNHICDGLV